MCMLHFSLVEYLVVRCLFLFKIFIANVYKNNNSFGCSKRFVFMISFSSDEFGKMKEEIPMAVLEARVKKATEEMETELKVEGKEPGWWKGMCGI